MRHKVVYSALGNGNKYLAGFLYELKWTFFSAKSDVFKTSQKQRF